MRHFGLKFKFAVFFAFLLLLMLAANSVWRDHMQEERVEGEMLAAAQMLAIEMDAVWDFMEINQGQFQRNEDGSYNVYCVVAAKVIAKKFTKESDGITIHYTNLQTRKQYDSPDAFETEALNALLANPELESYYTLVDYEGRPAFRYVQPLYLTESCLECHGEPKGELDIMGYPKEGFKVGDLAGAASIIIPADGYLQGAQGDAARETMFFAVLLACCIAATLFCVSRLVTRPTRKLAEAAEKVGRKDFNVNLGGVGYRDEMSDLAQRFAEMTEDLKIAYDGLESDVEARTSQLVEANLLLERQRAELESMNKILRRDTRLQNDFLATMSHEIRTPLTSILAFADIWEQANVTRNEEERRIVEEMKFSSQTLLAMVNDMLDVARLEAGKTELEFAAVDVADMLNDVREVNLFLAEKKRVNISLDISEDIPVVLTDSEKLRRVLENLVSNAVKFVDMGGAVDLSAEYLHDKEILCIAVTDNGCGIAPEDLPMIFERFVKGRNRERALGRSYGSSGLGLSLVKQLVELMGGRVEVESSVNVGSVFRVIMPVQEVDAVDYGI